MKYCINCGAALPDEARFCSQCGAKQGGAAPPSGAVSGSGPVSGSGSASGWGGASGPGARPASGPASAAASMNAALDAAASMGAAMQRGPLSNAAVLTPPARTDTPYRPAAPGTAPSPRTRPPVSAQNAAPGQSRAARKGRPSTFKRILVDILLVAVLVALQIGLIVFFSGFSDSGEPDMLTAQAVGFAPVLILLIYIFCLDTIEKEPLGLLIKLFLLEGLFGMTVVVFAEVFLDAFFSDLYAEYVYTTAYQLFEAVFLVALVEEFGKYFILKRCTWKHKAFNYRFDGIVYAVVTALGFAAFENMAYVADSGLSTALIRAVSAVPGHCVDGILMGIFYGQAKCFYARGQKGRAWRYRFLALAVPTAEHGFYDFIAGVDSELVSTLFLYYVWLLNAVVFVAVWRQSQMDEAVAEGVSP